MRRLTLIGLVIAAGCSEDTPQQESDKAAAMKLEPGQWEMTSEVTVAPAGGVKASETKSTTSTCITPEQAEKPGSELFAKDQSNCKYQTFYMSRGRLNAAMTCDQPGVANVGINIEGTFTGTSLDATTRMTMAIANGPTMNMTAKMSGRRVGPCTSEPGTAAG